MRIKIKYILVLSLLGLLMLISGCDKTEPQTDVMKDKIKDEKEDTSINYSVIEKDGKKGVAQNDKTIIEPQYDEVVIPNQHREVFYCKNGEESKFVNSKNKEIFTTQIDENNSKTKLYKEQ